MNQIQLKFLQVYYDKTLWLTVREVFVYSWIKLLCDVGNLLCLLLGASVLNLFELVECVLLQIGDRLITRPLHNQHNNENESRVLSHTVDSSKYDAVSVDATF